jgi:putative glutamine amidotransferase
MSRKPIIALDGGSAFDRQFLSPGQVANKTYSAAVAAAGGVPVMVTDPTALDQYAALADGLILCGSLTFSPDGGHREEISRMEGTDRPVFDDALLQAFVRAGKPVFGICLGLQGINVSFGGTLANNFKLTDGVEHMLTFHRCIAGEESVVGKIYGKEFYVNSRHNRKIDRLGEGLIATAYSPDGVIEEIRHQTLPIWAVEYHPERMRGDHREPPEGPDMTALFQWFVDKCRP